MKENRLCFSYTVITENRDDQLMFLVHNKQEEFVFPITCYEESYTGLGAVIELMKQTLDLNFDHIELVELSNAVVDDENIPIFVFRYNKELVDVDKLCLPDTDLKWQVFKDLKDVLKGYDISGAPSF